MNDVRANKHQNLKTLVAIFALFVILVPTAFAQGTLNYVSAANQNKQDFTLHNETGLEINEVYVSPTAAEDWEEDILGKDTLASGDSVDITFSRRREDNWDIKVVFKNGKSNVWTKFNLSQITDITLSFKNGKPWATWKNGEPAANQNKQDFTLHNETGLEINEVYVSPTAAEDWEEDILGKDTLASGDSVDITFSRRREVNWDIKVVFKNGKSNVWTKFNLSQITDITLSFKNGKPWATWKNGE